MVPAVLITALEKFASVDHALQNVENRGKLQERREQSGFAISLLMDIQAAQLTLW